MSQVPNMRGVQPKTGKPHKNSGRTKSPRTTASYDHLGRVKSLSCAVCDAPPPSDVHHILEGRIQNIKSPDYLAIPLCKLCHTGPGGIHGDRAMWNVYHANELQCLANTIERIYA